MICHTLSNIYVIRAKKETKTRQSVLMKCLLTCSMSILKTIFRIGKKVCKPNKYIIFWIQIFIISFYNKYSIIYTIVKAYLQNAYDSFLRKPMCMWLVKQNLNTIYRSSRKMITLKKLYAYLLLNIYFLNISNQFLIYLLMFI